MNIESKYSASFTAGALLYAETIVLLKYLNDDNISNITEQIKTNTLLKTNSESSRKRIIAEIIKRYHSVNNKVFQLCSEVSIAEQKILLFYSCLKTYPLLFDFMFNIVIEKWLSLELVINSSDMKRFLDKQSSAYSEIDTWTEKTHNKISSVTIKILKSAGILENNKLVKVNLSHSFLKQFVIWGDSWFLQALLINKEQRDKIING
ncbi:MAG: DUF1819 family protein [Candidatus Marinimicrobia bacterium]|jgi:hypothetical protein|nr:DUF1819 family protein [Candidatus Neomarinimicrobiota bacterium]MBT5362638.1 DUF1819 family protein [Candidatus Neomarinimicrobiota bacterium]MBT5758480.1 DUF1819 family protein [Candidatus Neomarinimicrobiota bacterium]MBT6632471.1 DUF1819 family protein [Candidatus Neomarinimicrobiota bacterium]MBT7114158.1 DUF1819 family protein [Candidatus Neomarinimicrobiota bacterium]